MHLHIFLSKFLALACTLSGLWLLSLPLWLDVPISLGLISICIFSRISSFLLLTISFFCCIFALEGLVRGFNLLSSSQYYREHEQFAITGKEAYQPNLNTTIESPHGDFLAIDPYLSKSLAQKRTIHFVTDSLGYRNLTDYQDQKVILVGDSFVVGNGFSQEFTLSAQLEKAGLENYSIAFPSNPNSYMARAVKFKQSKSSKSDNYKFAFFLYEGNDFELRDREESNLNQSYSEKYDLFRLKQLTRFIPFLHLPKYTFGLSRRAERILFPNSSNQLQFFSNNDFSVGMIKSQLKTSLSESVLLDLALEQEVVSKIACIFFIPSAYRVYYDLIDDPSKPKLNNPAPGLAAINQTFSPYSVPVVDLTPILSSELSPLSELEERLFWRDDSHWTPKGIEKIIPAVKSCLKQQEHSAPKQADWRIINTELHDQQGKYELVSGAGFIDQIKETDQGEFGLSFEGWALDPRSKNRVERLLLFDRDSLILSTQPVALRADVEQIFGKEARLSGFKFSCHSCKQHELKELKLIALLKDRRYFELSQAK